MNGFLGFMVNRSMVFGAEIPLVFCSWGPVKSELVLGFAAVDPPQAHVHGFDVLDYSSEVGDANSSIFFSLQGRLGLCPSHFDKSVAQGGIYLAEI